MQDELAAERPDLDISILHVNVIGDDEVSNLAMVTDLPILQDDETAAVWDQWEAAWRDVYIVDARNEFVWKMSLTSYPLDEEANYETLKQAFIDAAGG